MGRKDRGETKRKYKNMEIVLKETIKNTVTVKKLLRKRLNGAIQIVTIECHVSERGGVLPFYILGY